MRSPPYSPAATSARTTSRTCRSPTRSSDDTGSSNQRTSQSSAACMIRTACLRPYPPLASTYSSTSGPTAALAAAMRSRSRRGSVPHDSPILILTRGDALPDGPAGELLAQPAGVVGGEPTAAVDRHLPAHSTEQAVQGKVEQPGLEVPQGHVDGGEGVAGHTGAACVAQRRDHRGEGAADVERIRADHHVRKVVAHHGGAGRGPVRPPDAGVLAGPGPNQHDRRGVPGQRPVRLRCVGGDGVRGDLDRLHRGVECRSPGLRRHCRVSVIARTSAPTVTVRGGLPHPPPPVCARAAPRAPRGRAARH